MDTGADSSLPSSQESVGTLFSNNLPAGCFKALLSNNDNDGDDDFGLAAAEAEAKESGSVTPLVKQELKWLVQSRRLAQGKQELRVEEEEPSPQQDLTKAEEDKQRRRKEQNKQAARRFRRNKKLRESTLLEELAQLEAENRGLQAELAQLQRVKGQLVSLLTAASHSTGTTATPTTQHHCPATLPASPRPLFPPPSLALVTPPSPPYTPAVTPPSPCPVGHSGSALVAGPELLALADPLTRR